jgi:hypothetical protein
VNDAGPPDGWVGSLLGRVTGRLPELRRRLSVVRLLAEREVTTGPSIPLTWRQRLSLYRHGYTSRSGMLFDLVDGEYEDYLPDYRLELLDELGGAWGDVVGNKLAMHLLFGSFVDHVPDLYGVLVDGELRRNVPFLSPPPAGLDDTADTVARLDACLRAHGRLVLKPVYGHGGKDVSVCGEAPGHEGYYIDGDLRPPEEFVALVRGADEHLVSGFVEQADYAEALFPGSANTLRVLTLRDPETDEPFVSGAVHRIGTAETAPVDNWSRGGLSAEVRPDGTLSSAAQWSESASRTLWHDSHPDTGSRIEGIRVPNWAAIRERVLELATAFPHLPRLGWDVVVVDDDGGFVVLEINRHAGIETVQVHHPLLRNPRVRRFYEHHGFA